MVCDVEPVRAAIEFSERGRNIVSSTHVQRRDLKAKGTGGRLNLFGLAHDRWIIRVIQYCQPAETGNYFVQDFKPFAGSLDGLDRRPAPRPPGRARLATRPAPTGSLLAANTIGMTDVARLAAIVGGVALVTMTLTLCGPTRQQIHSKARRSPPSTDFDFYGISLDPAKFMQAPHKHARPLALRGSRLGAEVSNYRRLRTRGKRPSGRCGADNGDEIAPFHGFPEGSRRKICITQQISKPSRFGLG